MKCRNKWRALAAQFYVSSTEVINDLNAGSVCEHLAVAKLQAEGISCIWLVRDGLAVTSDCRHF